MAKQPIFDLQEAHQYFAAYCYKAAWEFIDKPERTPQENDRMIHLAIASLWHWTEREDCEKSNLSIGYWQVSRAYALAREPNNALKYGQLCLDITPQDAPFLLGYAHEAVARAEFAAGNEVKAREHLAEAWRHAEAVTDEKNHELLVKDLKGL